jgi:hypothetical protein
MQDHVHTDTQTQGSFCARIDCACNLSNPLKNLQIITSSRAYERVNTLIPKDHYFYLRNEKEKRKTYIFHSSNCQQAIN